jgi:hypothetical protein
VTVDVCHPNNTMQKSSCIVFLLLLLLHCVTSSKLFTTGCQRVFINSTLASNNETHVTYNFFDVDHFKSGNTTRVRVSFPSLSTVVREMRCNGDTELQFHFTGLYNSIGQFYYTTFMRMDTLVPEYNSTELNVNLTFSGKYSSDSKSIDELYNFTQVVTLTKADYLRSGCNDNLSMYYSSSNRITHIYSLVISNVLKPAISLPLAIIVFLLSRGELSRRRKHSAIVSNAAIIFSSICDLVYTITLVTIIKRRNFNFEERYPAIDITFQVVSSVSLQIALAAYSFRNYRYVHIRLMYRIISKSKTAQESKLIKWMLSKTAFRTIFFVTTVVFQIILIGVTVGGLVLIYRFKGVYVNIFTTYNMISIIFLLLLYSSVGLTQIKAFLVKGPKHFFFTSDPLLFRLELFVFTIIFIVCVVVSLIYSFVGYKVSIYINGLYILLEFVLGNGIIACIEIVTILRRCCVRDKQHSAVGVQLLEPSDQLMNEELIGVFRKYCIRRQMYKSYQLVSLWKTLENAKLDGQISYEKFVAVLNKYHTRIKFVFPSRMALLCNQVLEDYDGCEYINSVALEPLYSYVFQRVMDAYEHFPGSNEFKSHMAMRDLLNREFHLDSMSESITTDYQLVQA